MIINNQIESKKLPSFVIFCFFIFITLSFAYSIIKSFLNTIELSLKYQVNFFEIIWKIICTSPFDAFINILSILFLFIILFCFHFAFYKFNHKKSKLIKEIELKENSLEFRHFNENLNFECDYKKIDNLEMKIVTGINKTTFPLDTFGINHITLIFTINGKKKRFVVKSSNYTQLIYSITNIFKKVKNWQYYFRGAGKIKSVEEKINNCINYGIKEDETNKPPYIKNKSFAYFFILLVTIFVINLFYSKTIPHNSVFFAAILVFLLHITKDFSTLFKQDKLRKEYIFKKEKEIITDAASNKRKTLYEAPIEEIIENIPAKKVIFIKTVIFAIFSVAVFVFS